MSLLDLVSVICCAAGVLPLMLGTLSRTRRIPGPAVPLAAALFLWGLRAYAMLIDPGDARGLISVTTRFCDFAPVLLIMTLYGYMYEAELRRTLQAKRQLAAALRALPAVIAGVGATGQVTFCNRPRELARIVGVDEDIATAWTERKTLSQAGDGDDWDDMVLSECTCDMANMLGLTPWPPPATTSVELARGQELADGRAWIVVASPTSSPLSDGSVAILCALDITELNRLRRQVRQLEKSEAVGALAAGVAHELNNQVMAILCHADQVGAAKQGSETVAKADFEHHTESIRLAAERVQRMLQHLVKLASPAADGPRVEVDAEQLVRDAIHLFRPSLPPGVRLAIEIEDDLPTLQADADGVHQVILNLLLNARDALGDSGRITVRVESDRRPLPGPLTYRARGEDSRCLTIEVCDDGPGMVASVAQRVFDPFFSTKGPSAGSGLGLSVSYGIIRAHGGDITVDTSPGGGTRFTVYLPFEAAAPAEPVVLPAPTSGQPVILVVDDEKALVEVMAATLTLHGFEVLTALSGAEAAYLAQTTPRIDAMLVDLMLPDTEGMQLLDNLSVQHPYASAVILTGYSSPFTHAEAARRGVRVLSKPVRMEELLNALDRVASAAA
jgi:signal transduction histidine kinase/CheY-like chemotaxis protein